MLNCMVLPGQCVRNSTMREIFILFARLSPKIMEKREEVFHHKKIKRSAFRLNHSEVQRFIKSGNNCHFEINV